MCGLAEELDVDRLDGQRGGDAARTGLAVPGVSLRRERGELEDTSPPTIMHASMPLSPMC